MGNFNYTNIHIFDKKGSELPLIFDTNFKVEIPNLHGDNAVFFGVLNPDNSLSNFYCKYQGGKYNMYEFTDCTIYGNVFYAKIPCRVYNPNPLAEIPYVTGIANVEGHMIDGQQYFNSGEEDLSMELNPYYITNIIDVNVDYESLDIKFPSTTFNSGVMFDKVSTELVETQSLYILFEEDNTFKKVSEVYSEDIISWANRYKLLFFIDCREQQEFRFFDADNEEIVWTNKEIVDFTKDDYRVNIGFTASTEGNYEQRLMVCVVDTESVDEFGENGVITPIGSINLSGEAVGEDERYRTLFSNFGLPHPSEYANVFKNTDLNECKIDNIELNKNSKMMFLAYSEIFPYVGTYKALINAVSLLGYDDVFFKEWYKIINEDVNKNNYVTYDMSYHADLNANTINNLTIEERIQLKKLNWISMVYKINEEVADKSEDRWGFPYTKTVHAYDDKESLVKLIALKGWLQKYVIGLNCRIIDIGGEGIYYERYRLDSYGSYQQIMEWENVHHLAPYFEHIENEDILVNSEANISVNIGIDDAATPLEEFAKTRIKDLCTGYFDESNVYHHITSNITDNENYIYVGGTFGCTSNLDRYTLRASGTTDNFLFGNTFVVDSSLDSSIDALVDDFLRSVRSSRLRVTDNELELNTIDIYNNRSKSVIFKNPPIIQLEKANIRVFSNLWSKSINYKVYPDLRDDTKMSYFIENEITGEIEGTVDYITLIPPTFIGENEESIILKPFGKENISITKVVDYNVVSDFVIPHKTYCKNNATYGLRYSADNIYNLPFFSILGYQVDKINNNLPVDTEFILEILDGKMIFPDFENNRTIYLNFNFDNNVTEQNVEVNIVYNSDEFKPISYNIADSSINRFLEEVAYTDFTEQYKDSPDDVINYDFVHKITVNNSGRFTVDVIGFDSHNNIFAANCDGTTLIKMPEIGLSIYTNKKQEGDILGDNNQEHWQKLKDSFIDFCLYKPNYLISGIVPKVDDKNKTISITYPSYSYSLHKPERGEYVHFSNITDRYAIKAIDTLKTNTFARNKTIFTYEDYTLIAEANCPMRYTRVLEATDYDAIAGLNGDVYPDYDKNKLTVSNYLDKFYDSEYTLSDINIVFYNELGGYPIAQMYGNMANEKAFYKEHSLKDSYTNNDFRIHIADDSWRGYVWTKVKETESQLLVGRLAQAILDAYNDSEWEIEKYNYTTVEEEMDEEAGEMVEVETEHSLHVPYDKLEKPAKYIAKKLFENFELGSINNPNHTYNDLLRISTNETDDESLYIQEKHKNFINQLLNGLNYERINAGNISSVTSPGSSFAIMAEGKTLLYVNYIFDTIVENGCILEYPYKEDGTLLRTNIFQDVASLIATYNYDDIIGAEVSKLFTDYTDKDDYDLSIFDRISNEFLDNNKIENVDGNVQYSRIAVTPIDVYKYLNSTSNSIHPNDEVELKNLLTLWKSVHMQDEETWINNDCDEYMDERYDPATVASKYPIDMSSSMDICHFNASGLLSEYFRDKSKNIYDAYVHMLDDAQEYYSATKGTNYPWRSEDTPYFVELLAADAYGRKRISNFKDILSVYLDDEFRPSADYNKIVLETVLESMKNVKEINDKVHTDLTARLYNKLKRLSNIYESCEDKKLVYGGKSVFSLVTDSENYRKVYPNLEQVVPLDGSIYINSRGYQLVTDNITNGDYTLEIGDYIKIGDKYAKIGFIDKNTDKFIIKTDLPMCTFTNEEYLFPYTYINVPINIYEAIKFDYIILDEAPDTKPHSFTTETLAVYDEFLKFPYGYYNGELYEFMIDESASDDSSFGYEDIKLSFSFTDDFGKNNNIVVNDRGSDVTEKFEIWKKTRGPWADEEDIEKINDLFIYNHYDKNSTSVYNGIMTFTDNAGYFTDIKYYKLKDNDKNGVFIVGNTNTADLIIINYFLITDTKKVYNFCKQKYDKTVDFYKEDGSVKTAAYVNFYQLIDESDLSEVITEITNECVINNVPYIATFFDPTHYGITDEKITKMPDFYSTIKTRFTNAVVKLNYIKSNHHMFLSSGWMSKYASSMSQCYWQKVTDVDIINNFESFRKLDTNKTVKIIYIEKVKDNTSGYDVYIDEEREIQVTLFSRNIPKNWIESTKNENIELTPSKSYSKAKSYVVSNGYSLNIPETEFVDNNGEWLLHADDYIKTTFTPDVSNYCTTLVKVNNVVYLRNTKEYQIFLGKKIYQFSKEQYNELYYSKKLTTNAYKKATENATLEIIKTNLLCIFAKCLYSMGSTISTLEEIVQNNIRRYFAAMYVYYCWMAIRIADNMKNITSVYTTEVNDALSESNVIINKYLYLTDPYLANKGFDMMKGFRDGLYNYFYAEDSSTSEILRGDTNDIIYNDDMISVYDKLLSVSSMAAMQNLKDTNWVSMGEVHVEDIIGLDALYAVTTHSNPNEIKTEDTYDKELEYVDYDTVYVEDSIYKTSYEKDKDSSILSPDEIDDKEYYVKVGNNLKSGYGEVTEDLPSNAITSVKDMANSSYISTYIKPTWMAPIKIGVLDKEIIKKSTLDPNWDYLYVMFESNIFKTTFRMHEKVKIVFESTHIKKYIGQSTFEIVGYDLTSNSIILKGVINDEYLNAKEKDVWARLYTEKNDDNTYTVLKEVTADDEYDKIIKEDGLTKYFVKTDELLTVNSSYYTMKDVVLQAYDDDGHMLFDEDGVPITHTVTVSIPVKYASATGENVDGPGDDSIIVDEDIEDDEFNDGSNINSSEEIVWYYRAHAVVPDGTTILPVSLYAQTSESVNMYISYAHHAFADYQMKVESSVEYDNGTTEVYLEYNPVNRKLIDFIDDTFSITSREFNIGEGMGAWMNSERLTIRLNDSRPDIVNDSVYKYKDIPIELSEENNLIAFDVDLKGTGINEEEYTNYWKVYKKSSITDEMELAFESFNPILYLDYTDKGVYNIESFVFDKYGNMASKMYKGIYKIK